LTEQESVKRIWDTALGELEIQVSRHNYQTWLEKTVGVDYSGGEFVIGVPNAFVAEYLEQNQRSLIEKTLIGLTRREARVVFRVEGAGQAPDGPAPPAATAPPAETAGFNPKYTFDHFVTGGGNQLAHAAANSVVENLGQSYNPLFICGGVGLGKTHLLHAIGQAALARQQRVAYLSGERFTNDFITAIREGWTEDFRRHYRNVDILMLDDVQFISGKAKTEECFFHTFNELHSHNRQIVLTSDQQPKSIPKLAERLRSRFEWGLIADIQPPDIQTRRDILRSKAEQQDTYLPEAVLELIARRTDHSIRELEGNLNRVLAYARLLQAPFTPELALRALESIARKNPDGGGAPAQVIATVAASFDLMPGDLISLRRDKEINLARQVATYLIREQNGCPLTQIGLQFSHRNPSTVRHACEKISAELDSSPWLRRRVAEIRQQIHSS